MSSKLTGFLLLVALAAAVSLGTNVKAGGEDVEVDEVEVYIEWNSTDTDYGIQFFWDSTGFKRMRARPEGGATALDVRTGGGVKKQGLTEGFFESVEPPSSVVSLEKFLERFPEGTWQFKGKSLDGGEMYGETEFTHTLPAPPENLYPEEDDVVSHQGFEAGFDEVTEDTDGNLIDIELYVLVIEKEDDDPILQTFEVVLPPTRTSIWIPEEFLEPDTEYKLEVIAQEESGNRTIAEEGAFTTDGP